MGLNKGNTVNYYIVKYVVSFTLSQSNIVYSGFLKILAYSHLNYTNRNFIYLQFYFCTQFILY
jgi:hypothetical protein